jgi:hypothetical protein
VQTAIRVALSALVLSLCVDGFTARTPARARERLLVLNAPSAASQGFDSILELTARGRSSIVVDVDKQLIGSRDFLCRPTKPFHILLSQGDFVSRTHGFLILSRGGRTLHTLPSAEFGALAMAYDQNGALYTVATAGKIFRDNLPFASLPPGRSVGRVAVDSRGYVYVTSALSVEGESPRLFRVDPAGQVSVFADETQGLDGPFGLAIDREDNVFVANLETVFFSSFILKFDASGAASVFASDFEPVVRSMTFDADGNLFATADSPHAIMKFTPTGDRSVFADANNGINFPEAIRSCAG